MILRALEFIAIFTVFLACLYTMMGGYMNESLEPMVVLGVSLFLTTSVSILLDRKTRKGK